MIRYQLTTPPGPSIFKPAGRTPVPAGRSGPAPPGPPDLVCSERFPAVST
ncbi:hypothetical protein B0I32_105295 [Nonomuraea fuscirosea]|uniref:Uncharacterized protein n=1 Tax=Nonomuraea fuscirosea TaxID=1291556 RepID=A0A2T0N3W5_9ACTN|nr:hypothetical protein B0I32_105295 [Nonomuraea fuscirosea]